MSSASAHGADDDWPRMDAKTHRELYTCVALQAGIQRRGDGLNNAQAGMQGTLGVVFMRDRPAKVHEQTITEILGHMAFVLLDDLGGGCLVGSDHLAQVFGVELLGEFRGVRQITEHHGQVPTFGFGSSMGRLRGDGWLTVRHIDLCSRWSKLGRCRGRDSDGVGSGWLACYCRLHRGLSITGPYQALIILIVGYLPKGEFFPDLHQ